MTHSTAAHTATPTNTFVAVGPLKLRSRALAFQLLLLLSLQFLLGIVANLYVTIPATHPGSNAADFFAGIVQGMGWALADGAWSLQLHVLTGLALIVLGITFIAVAYRTRERLWMICAPLSIFGMIIAAINGASFINYGETLSSLLMSLGFLIALVPLLVGLFLTPRLKS